MRNNAVFFLLIAQERQRARERTTHACTVNKFPPKLGLRDAPLETLGARDIDRPLTMFAAADAVTMTLTRIIVRLYLR